MLLLNTVLLVFPHTVYVFLGKACEEVFEWQMLHKIKMYCILLAANSILEVWRYANKHKGLMLLG